MRAALAERHGEVIQRAVEKASVAVCGLGGLGSNVAVALARAGVGRLHLIDFDEVDITNLNRQQYDACQTGRSKTDALKENLLRISPYISIETDNTRITEENAARLLAGEDIICEAFDSAEDKAMLVNFLLENMPEKYVVAASGMAGLESANTIKTRKVAGRFYLCGDGKSDIADGRRLVCVQSDGMCGSPGQHDTEDNHGTLRSVKSGRLAEGQAYISRKKKSKRKKEI